MFRYRVDALVPCIYLLLGLPNAFLSFLSKDSEVLFLRLFHMKMISTPFLI